MPWGRCPYEAVRPWDSRPAQLTGPGQHLPPSPRCSGDLPRIPADLWRCEHFTLELGSCIIKQKSKEFINKTDIVRSLV